MSCNYAEGLSAYHDKGVLGVAERFDDEETVAKKCRQLADWMLNAKKVVVHTGAGISTSAGIPDFRGPKGVWTLEEKGEKPNVNISFSDAIPTKTHLALKALVQHNYVHYVVTQNIDGLHLRSGLSRQYLSEMHGNMFLEQCPKCKRQFIRSSPAPTVGQKPTGNPCKGGRGARPCRSASLVDNILDWEHDLPDKDLDLAFMHSTLADLNICLGTTLQIVPSGNLPLRNRRYGGKLVICNLQPTKHDKKADLLIPMYVDKIMEKLCKFLGVEIPEYSADEDPTKRVPCDGEWTIPASQVQALERVYNAQVKEMNNKKRQRDAGVAQSFEDEIKDVDKKKLKKEESPAEAPSSNNLE